MKKAIIFAPHQDDEINIAGGILSSLLANNIEVKVVYSTNGDYCTKASTRISECKKALKVFGISEENIYFMGYSDQTREEDTHLYMTEKNSIWKSKKNIMKTYHPFGENEVSMIYEKKHHEFNKDNFIKDIVYVLEDYKPDYIYCIDFDSHADHRALSLSVEKAIGLLINKHIDYRPIIYKAFAYPTFYYGYKDLNNINIKSTAFKTEPYSYCDMENPYYSWASRIRFPVSEKVCNKFLLKNKVFSALNCHKSQCINGRASSTINGDQIFWQRRTDNLLNESKLTVTSGNMEKLHDFMLFDCNNIMGGDSKKVVLESNAWMPDKNDKVPEINVSFNKKKKISEINLYHAIGTSDFFNKIEVIADNDYSNTYELVREKDNISRLNFDDNIFTKNLKIRMLGKTGDNAGFSELEVFEFSDSLIQLIKLEIDGDFAYKYYYSNESFKIYSYDGVKFRYLDKDEYKIISDDVIVENDKFLLKKHSNNIRVQLKNNDTIYDDVILVKKNIISVINNIIINIVNSVVVAICYSKQKIIRKIKRLLKVN